MPFFSSINPPPSVPYTAERALGVQRGYVLIYMQRIDKVATLPVRPSTNPTDATQHFAQTTRSTRLSGTFAETDPSGPGIYGDGWVLW